MLGHGNFMKCSSYLSTDQEFPKTPTYPSFSFAEASVYMWKIQLSGCFNVKERLANRCFPITVRQEQSSNFKIRFQFQVQRNVMILFLSFAGSGG